MLAELIRAARGPGALFLFEHVALGVIAQAQRRLTIHDAPRAIGDTDIIVVEMQRIVVEGLRCVVLDRAIDLFLFHSKSSIDQQRPHAPLIGSEQRRIQALKSIDQSEEVGSDQTVVGHHSAVIQRESDQLRIRCRGHELGVAEVPVIIRAVGREIAAHGQIVAGHQLEGEAQVVGECLQDLVHDPESVRFDVGIRIHEGTAADVRRGAAGCQAGGSHCGRAGVRRGDGAGEIAAHGHRRVAAVEQAGGRHVTARKLQLVAQGDGVADMQVKIAAEGMEVGAAPIGQISRKGRAARALLDRETLNAAAGIPSGQWIESREARIADTGAGTLDR